MIGVAQHRKGQAHGKSRLRCPIEAVVPILRASRAVRSGSREARGLDQHQIELAVRVLRASKDAGSVSMDA
jgi:hypothetical protein